MGELPKLKTSTKIAAIAVPLALMFVGAGCAKLADEAVLPVSVPVEQMAKSAEEIEAIQAKKNEEGDMVADDLTVALIELGDGSISADSIGCGDKIHREAQTDSVLADALTTLFSVRDSNYEEKYNALWQSKLAVEKIQSRDGVTTEVWLKGQTQSGGVCDDPRIKAQIEGTIKRLKPKYQVYLNGSEANYRCLGDMSGECK
jgi:hypothetical protein